MPFANRIPQPDTPLVPLLYSVAQNSGIVVQQKFVPKNQDGSIFDCTAATTAQFLSGNGSLPPLNPNGSMNPTIITADATGVVIEFSSANIVALLTSSFTQTPLYTLMIDDGSGGVPAGVGRASIQFTA